MATWRAIIERENGELWFGGTSGGCVYHRGRFTPPVCEGARVHDSGVFALTNWPTAVWWQGGRDARCAGMALPGSCCAAGWIGVRSFLELRDGALWVASASGFTV